MRIILLAALCLIQVLSLTAQTAGDALRFSQYNPTATARSVGVGGAIGALGGDFSVLSVNPAGIAVYRQSEVMISPALYLVNTESQLENGPITDDNTTNLHLANVGFVVASTRRERKWKAVNFGFGLNRNANYNQQIFYRGNSAGSIVDRFVALAQGVAPIDLFDPEEGIALDVGAIYQPDPNDPTFYENDLFAGDRLDRSQSARLRGATDEMVLSLGGNYEHKLYVGATIGVTFPRYEEEKSYLETDTPDNIDFFDELLFEEALITTGVGINAKLGLTYRANQALRLGLAYHTPTATSLSDEYQNEIRFDILFPDGTFESRTARSLLGEFTYTLYTPGRIVGQVGYIFGKSGFVSAEIDWADYSSASYSFADTNDPRNQQLEQDLNDEIDAAFKSAVNVRLGAEYVLQEKFRVRGGVQLLQSPFEVDTSDGFDTRFSVGAGVREQSFFIDLGLQFSSADQTFLPYVVPGGTSPMVDNTVNGTLIVLTAGLKI